MAEERVKTTLSINREVLRVFRANCKKKGLVASWVVEDMLKNWNASIEENYPKDLKR